MKFSERQGFTRVRDVLQISDIDDGLRNKLWNVVLSTFFSEPPASDVLSRVPVVEALFRRLWNDYFKLPTDRIGHWYSPAVEVVRTYFLTSQWFLIYDLIEFLANNGPYWGESFTQLVNKVLKEEMAGYRLLSGRVVQITSEDEIESIEQALETGDPLKPVTSHLRQALNRLADRKEPDYRNSIKESISAIESLSKLMSGLSQATLKNALNAVEARTKLHPSLKEAFQKLYGYTSDADGIRHALLDEHLLDLEDAKFMLVSCSAFVNYMVVKAKKAELKV